MRIDPDGFGTTTMVAHHSVGLFIRDITPRLSCVESLASLSHVMVLVCF